MGLPSLLHSLVFLWIVASSTFGVGYGQNGTLNLLDFGASGNGVADDTGAFDTAWKTLCSTGQTLHIPAGKTFVVKPLKLEGPCKSSSVVIQIDGNIVGPSTLGEWQNACALKCWLCFMSVNGLVIKGKGVIDGKGSIWWNQKTQSIDALYFNKCGQLQLSGITCRDSPRVHIFLFRSNGAHISNVHVSAPEDSPNTDGIDVSASSQVTIRDSVIGTGDDCVAIKGGASFVNVTHVTCGPGHGFSVGSLGMVPSTADEVHDIYFQNCNCDKTMNCARIKTWMGGSGFAKEIFYNHMTLQQSQNPILIDQHYCNGGHSCTVMAGAVKVSGITFSGFTGSSASEQAITLNCSDSGCPNILLDHVSLTSGIGKPLRSACYKATGKASFTDPPVPCLNSKQNLAPVTAPLPITY
ncbi:hypothetical protein ACLB2K_040404 [Fragaria x ananassa]